MVRRRLAFLSALAVGVAIVGGTIALGAAPATPTAGRPRTAPMATASPSTSCYVTVGTCSIHPCVEFVAPPRTAVRPRATYSRRIACDELPPAGPTVRPAPTQP